MHSSLVINSKQLNVNLSVTSMERTQFEQELCYILSLKRKSSLVLRKKRKVRNFYLFTSLMMLSLNQLTLLQIPTNCVNSFLINFFIQFLHSDVHVKEFRKLILKLSRLFAKGKCLDSSQSGFHFKTLFWSFSLPQVLRNWMVVATFFDLKII